MRTTKEEKDMCTVIHASWTTQYCYCLAYEAHEQVLKWNQRGLNENNFSLQERELWHESDLKERKPWIKNGCQLDDRRPGEAHAQ